MNRAPGAPLLGFDIGGTTCAVIRGSERGEVVDRLQIETQAERGPEAILDELFEAAAELERRQGEARACGVAIGGPLELDRGRVLSIPNLPGWEDISLRRWFEERLGLPVNLEHDAAACCLAEQVWGAAIGIDRVAYLTCGSGFGVGFVVDGAPYHGSTGYSMEIGHVRYREQGPVAFGKRGCFEAFGAGNSLPKLAAWLHPKRWSAHPPTGPELSRLARDGDAEACQVLERNAVAVGDACALLGDLLVPELILLGSLARYLEPWWLDGVRRRFQGEVLPHVAAQCRIARPGLGERLQDASALVLARG